jgi:hypothetical protein
MLPKLKPSMKVLLKGYKSSTESFRLVFESCKITLKGVTKIKLKYESSTESFGMSLKVVK